MDVITALRQVQAKPIMVFDHLSARLPQKFREQEKRRHQRALTAARLALEQVRSARLRDLHRCVTAFEAMRPADQEQVSAWLRRWAERTSAAPGNVGAAYVAEHSAAAGIAARAPTPDDWADAVADMYDEDAEESDEWLQEVDDSVPEDTGAPAPEERTPAAPFFEDTEEGAAGAAGAELAHLETDPAALALRIHALRTAWQHAAVAQAAADADVVTETPNQLRITHAERLLYDAIMLGALDDAGALQLDPEAAAVAREVARRVAPEVPEEAVTDPTLLTWLQRQNSALVHSYTRSTRTLENSIYEQAMQLCELMGVPMLTTGDGATPNSDAVHEAEAYCSSLVRHGFADMVASEDSDTVLYEVPMLRGLTSGAPGALELVHSRRLRERLFPRVYGEQESRERMLQFALLCGTDFNRTVPGIGVVRAHRFMRHFSSIEAVLAAYSEKYAPPDGLSLAEYLEELESARQVFENPPSVTRIARAAGFDAVYPPAAGEPPIGGPEWRRILGIGEQPARTEAKPAPYDPSALAAFLSVYGIGHGAAAPSDPVPSA